MCLGTRGYPSWLMPYPRLLARGLCRPQAARQRHSRCRVPTVEGGDRTSCRSAAKPKLWLPMDIFSCKAVHWAWPKDRKPVTTTFKVPRLT